MFKVSGGDHRVSTHYWGRLVRVLAFGGLSFKICQSVMGQKVVSEGARIKGPEVGTNLGLSLSQRLLVSW